MVSSAGVLWLSSGLGSVPGWGIKIPQATLHAQKKKDLSFITDEPRDFGVITISVSVFLSLCSSFSSF